MRLIASGFAAITASLLVGWLAGAWPGPRKLRPVRLHRGEWLVQAGITVGLIPFWLAVGLVGLASFLFIWMLSGLLVVALPGAVVALFLPKVWVMRRRSQRMFELQASWPDGLRDLVASISSGMSLARGLEQLSVSGPAPLRQAFARFSSLSRAAGVVPALEAIKADLAQPTSDRIIEVLIVAHERGGPIVLSILRDLTEAITKDTWAAEELATLSLEQKINARVVFIIPWVVLAFITTRPGPFRDFYASSAGVLVVAVGGAASVFGMWLASKLGKEPDEPRVFGRIAS
jgi:tight adherence protein B